jgi:phosphatidylethanolamine-binding protein (PEBP) family uncharacterized protein
MEPVKVTLIVSLIGVVLALGGCGGSTKGAPTQDNGGQSPTSSTLASPTQQTNSGPEAAPGATLEVRIPTLLRDSRIPRRYTCDGTNTSLPAQWTNVPSGAVELALFVVKLMPVHGKLFFDWAVAGLSPSLHGLTAGQLPPGAIVGRNSFGNLGYSICPGNGTGKEHYVMRVLALDRPLAVRPGAGAETMYHAAERSAKAVGLGGGAYTPPRG